MGTRYVSFVLGTGSYCVPVDQVVQILRNESILTVPKAPSYVKGVINLRGDVIPIIDLRARLDVTEEAVGAKKRIVVVQLGKRSYGLLVDEVREIVDLQEEAVTQDMMQLFGARTQLIRGIARRGDSLFFLLDLPGIFWAGRDAVPGGVDPGRVPEASPGAAEPAARDDSSAAPADR